MKINDIHNRYVLPTIEEQLLMDTNDLIHTQNSLKKELFSLDKELMTLSPTMLWPNS